VPWAVAGGVLLLLAGIGVIVVTRKRD